MTPGVLFLHQSCGGRGGLSPSVPAGRFILNVMWLRWELMNL